MKELPEAAIWLVHNHPTSTGCVFVCAYTAGVNKLVLHTRTHVLNTRTHVHVAASKRPFARALDNRPRFLFRSPPIHAVVPITLHPCFVKVPHPKHSRSGVHASLHVRLTSAPPATSAAAADSEPALQAQHSGVSRMPSTASAWAPTSSSNLTCRCVGLQSVECKHRRIGIWIICMRGHFYARSLYGPARLTTGSSLEPGGGPYRASHT